MGYYVIKYNLKFQHINEKSHLYLIDGNFKVLVKLMKINKFLGVIIHVVC